MIATPLLARRESWSALQTAFRWPRPAAFNIAEASVGHWARTAPERVALKMLDGADRVQTWRYRDLDRAGAQCATMLAAHGVGAGDRVAILLPQAPETIIVHLGAYRLGAIVVPLFTLFGADGLAFRLADSGARAIVTDAANLPKLAGIRADLPALAWAFPTYGPGDGPGDRPGDGARDFHAECAMARDSAARRATPPDTPAFLSYTSGTTGPPKGALHAHRVLIGHLPGVELPHEFFPQPGDCLWTPADWAWMGGLTNVMLPALLYGVPLVAHRFAKFDPERAYWLIERLGVRNTFLPPTALKLMRQSPPRAPLNLRSVASGGEALGAEMVAWGQAALGQTINEFYGQTECNLVLANTASVAPVRPGSTGRAVPGHSVAVIDADGTPLPPDATGEIAVRRPDPAMFLGYWNRPEKTAEKFIGDWMRTGDEGRMDAEGYVYFSARSDDVITSSGYRIGPTEIEQCLTAHPAVAMAAVIGVPDPVRTEIVRAFVVAAEPIAPEALIAHVRDRLSPHMAPREIVFRDTLPMTATGKILRRALRDDGG